MRPRLLSPLVLALAAAGCFGTKKPAAAQRPNFLGDVPYLAQSRLLDTTGAPDAQHVVILSPAPIDSVASFYRNRLPEKGWMIMGDTHDSARVTLYLVRNGAPLWIQIDAAGPDSRVGFTAAAATPAPQPTPGR